MEDRSLFEFVSSTNIMRLFSQKKLQGFPFLYLIINSGYAVYEHPVSKTFLTTRLQKRLCSQFAYGRQRKILLVSAVIILLNVRSFVPRPSYSLNAAVL